MTFRSFCAATAALLLAAALPRAAHAGELVLETGPSAGVTTWRTDAFLAQGLRGGFRPIPQLAFDVEGRTGYATVDQRVTASIGLGMTVFFLTKDVRPFARLGLVHQHEESASNVREKPLETLSAVGPDVRHRSAATSSLGLEIRAMRQKQTEVFVAADAFAALFADGRGPSLYGGGELWLGLHYAL